MFVYQQPKRTVNIEISDMILVTAAAGNVGRQIVGELVKKRPEGQGIRYQP